MKNSLKNRKISFRDPAGRLWDMEGRILRVVTGLGMADLKSFLATETAKKSEQAHRLVSTRFLETDEVEALFEKTDSNFNFAVEHPKVPFVSFPYEWPPEMLYEAGRLILDFAQALLDEGFGLKDATPYNVLYQGPKPIFIDLLSFERRDPHDPTWLAYAQFVRTFLLPLLVKKHFGLAPHLLLTTCRDGLQPEEVYRMCGPFKKWLPPFLTLVTLPKWLGSKDPEDDRRVYRKKSIDNVEKARFILKSLFKHLRRQLDKLAPGVSQASVWSDYMKADHLSSKGYLIAKEKFVEGVITEFSPKKVLDVGCNTGTFSILAAGKGARVVAIDSDAVVVGQVWRSASREGLDILPLVVDITRPSPGIGWQNQECPSFLERAQGVFDCLMMLAVLHHMLITERIPLEEILHLAAKITKDLLVIEYIGPEDPLFQQLTRGRGDLFVYFKKDFFEKHCCHYFKIIRSQALSATRRIYLLRKRG